MQSAPKTTDAKRAYMRAWYVKNREKRLPVMREYARLRKSRRARDSRLPHTSVPRDLNGELGLIAMVFRLAKEDLAHAIECTCADIEAVTEGCGHHYRTARRFLLGTREEWRAHRDMLCELVGMDPARLHAETLRILGVRKRDTQRDYGQVVSALSGEGR